MKSSLWIMIMLAHLVSGCTTRVEHTESNGTATSKATDSDLAMHLVRIHIPLTGGTMGSKEERDRYVALEDVLDKAAQESGTGELDGNEIGGGEYTIWLYGSDGPKLAAVVKKALAREKLPKGSTIFVRHGGVEDEKAREETIPLP